MRATESLIHLKRNSVTLSKAFFEQKVAESAKEDKTKRSFEI